MEYGDESLFAIDDHSIGHEPHDLSGDSGIGGGLGAGYDDHHSEPDQPAPPEHPPHPGHTEQTGHPEQTGDHTTHGDAPHGAGHGAGSPPHPHVPPGHLYVDYEGHHYDAGRVDVDRDHDGRADTAVIHSPGQDEYYTDRNGDGQADELTIFAPDGHLISHEQLGSDGHWHETPYGGHGGHTDSAGHIAVNYNGTRYDAGQATVDSNGDGHADTAIIRSPGQIEYYIDRDGDGRADELTITTPGGHLISHEEVDPKSGRWRETPLTGPLPKGG